MRELQTYLIVDDDADDIDFFCEAIEKIDSTARCITASNGEEAILLLGKTKHTLPNMIFLDLNMPRMDGKSCLVELRKENRFRDIPVVIYTTSTHPKDREETMSLGADYFLTKATSFKRLCEDIQQAIETVKLKEISNKP